VASSWAAATGCIIWGSRDAYVVGSTQQVAPACG